MNRENENQYFYFLQSVQGIGKKTIRNLLNEFLCTKDIFHASEKELLHFLTIKQTTSFLRARESFDWRKVCESLDKQNLHYYSMRDLEYPKRLRQIQDAPISLFVKGRLPAEDRPSAAIVGTRSCSQYGRNMTEIYAKMMTELGFNIISGMARGIDGIAQNITVSNHGNTYAVLGCGADLCYPPENQVLYDKIAQSGGIISEYFPGTQPKPQLFPPRNRIISGLCDILLVIEARLQSGTCITVDMALEQGRDIYVLPGRLNDPLSVGCNRLIRQGAYMLPPPQEFREELQDRWKNLGSKKIMQDEVQEEKLEIHSLSRMEQLIYMHLDLTPVSVDELLTCIRLDGQQEVTLSETYTALTALCLKKLIYNSSGGLYCKKGI